MNQLPKVEKTTIFRFSFDGVIKFRIRFRSDEKKMVFEIYRDDQEEMNFLATFNLDTDFDINDVVRLFASMGKDGSYEGLGNNGIIGVFSEETTDMRFGTVEPKGNIGVVIALRSRDDLHAAAVEVSKVIIQMYDKRTCDWDHVMQTIYQHTGCKLLGVTIKYDPIPQVEWCGHQVDLK